MLSTLDSWLANALADEINRITYLSETGQIDRRAAVVRAVGWALAADRSMSEVH